ncbi:MAG: hypothetical protein H6923_03300 [Alphaproteobacteria bacterium]|nr:hypothetical protein [Alphaproteobacteria bacterium]
MKALAAIAAGLALVALAGCQTTPDPALAQDPNYSVGYSDGCATGDSRMVGFDKTVTRNAQLWSDSEAYRAGWRRGYGICGAGRTNNLTNERRDDFFSTGRYDQGAVKP